MIGPAAVLFVALPSGFGGSSRSLATLLDELDPPPERILASPAGSWIASTSRRAVEQVEAIPGLDRSRWWRLVAALSVARIAWRRRRNLVAIHANGLAELNLVVLAALVTRTRVVVWVHDAEPTRWSRRLTPVAVRLTGATCMAVTAASADDLVRRRLVAPGRPVVVPNPVEPVGVEADGPLGEWVVGYLGSATAQKGFDLLPALVRALEDTPIRFLVVADPEGELGSVIDDLRTMPRVSVIDPTPDVASVYRRCSVVVCPSRAESFGRVAAEAMSAGLPVVASDLPALREVVGDAGLLVERGDAAELARAVRRLHADPRLTADLGRRGQKRSAAYRPATVAAAVAALHAGAAPETDT